jgi:DNA-directed RNA polymerase specialized sigma24 family protein
MTVSDYIQAHYTKMKRMASAIAFKFHLDQDDHTQNCMLQAIKYQDHYHDAGLNSFFAWWHLLCTRKAIDAYRNLKKVPMMVDDTHAHSIPYIYSQMEDRTTIAATYWRLRKRFGSKRTIIMYMVSRASPMAEIAATFSLNENTVRAHIHKCRKYLKTDMIK